MTVNSVVNAKLSSDQKETMILHGNTLIEILPLSDLYTVYKDHYRLTVFVHKVRECVVCGREGVLLLKTKDKGGKLHVDLYTDDFVLMTVDHIIPKKIGKELMLAKQQIEDLSNKQPMCNPCNNKKSDKEISIEELKLKILQNGYPYKHKGVEIIRQLVHNEGIFSRNLEGII